MSLLKKGGEITAAEVSIALLPMGSADEQYLFNISSIVR